MKKYDELVKKALEMIENDDELMVELVDELDGYDGFADGFRCYPMDELDNIYYGCPASKIINDMTKNFCISDKYFYFSIYGLESTDDVSDLYKQNTTYGEIFDKVLKNKNRLYFYNKDFKKLLNQIENYTEDFEE